MASGSISLLAIGGVGPAELLLGVFFVAVGVPLVLIGRRLLRGEYHPQYLRTQFRRGKQDAEDEE